MTRVLGRETGTDSRPTAHLGHYRARDGSRGVPLHLDIDTPHAACVVGKRGYGKSYTLGVLAEALARARGVAPVVVDPMGVFGTLADTATDPDAVPAEVVCAPSVRPDALDPRSWCALVGLSPESGAGGLVWQAATAESTVSRMDDHVQAADAPVADRRAASNHLSLVASWDVFTPDGLAAGELATPAATVVDVSGMNPAPANAVVRGVVDALYRARVEQRIDRLPWLLVDEAHTFFDGVAADALRAILTRGRVPGVSLAVATQRPSAVPPVAISQSDVLVAHRLTSRADLDALERVRPTYVDGTLSERLPEEVGDVVVIDDATESVHAARIRKRHTPHGGGSPSASGVAGDDTQS